MTENERKIKDAYHQIHTVLRLYKFESLDWQYCSCLEYNVRFTLQRRDIRDATNSQAVLWVALAEQTSCTEGSELQDSQEHLMRALTWG